MRNTVYPHLWNAKPLKKNQSWLTSAQEWTNSWAGVSLHNSSAHRNIYLFIFFFFAYFTFIIPLQ